MNYKDNEFNRGVIMPGPLGQNHFWSKSRDYGPSSGSTEGGGADKMGEPYDPNKNWFLHERVCNCSACKDAFATCATWKIGPPVYDGQKKVMYKEAETTTVNRSTAARIIDGLINDCIVTFSTQPIYGKLIVSDLNSEWEYVMDPGGDGRPHILSQDLVEDIYTDKRKLPLIEAVKLENKGTTLNVVMVLTKFINRQS
ncbi:MULTISPECIES: hypothetical protein [Pseudomonas]|uniref:hypothetical protein n=1 Tax=Pseudomonas TaxID=286 RepID=UPI001FF6DCF4|nr:hypothetical protein [Pseudomonas sp. YL2]